ncbi:rRNA maturation RNase YbeY [Polyangium mundeleinium]|uniref:Endoribonuclease YbeY n=1 Tax=Polyangium mundeleinium TaxID=2995306 RepID=A0ABT5EJ29_9BACT|nr:rRNA maturation RNase YbeY [Polyangium mundeleinium]MDC0741814.1 rRNA maturation RNase YbeY [Polyangium mundeleinium]
MATTKKGKPAPPAPAPNVVEVATRGGPFEGASPVVIRRRAGKMLEHLGLAAVELSIALVDDTTIHELNRSYRHKDKPTDVLSFPLHERPPGWKPKGAKGAEIGAGWPHAGPLGDVILSIDTARRQAAEQGRPLLAELTMLLAHGLLHLVGYDHRTAAEDREMTARTRELEAAASARTAGAPR